MPGRSYRSSMRRHRQVLPAVPDYDSALIGEPRKIATKRLRRVGGNADLEVLFHADRRPVVGKVAQAPETVR